MIKPQKVREILLLPPDIDAKAGIRRLRIDEGKTIKEIQSDNSKGKHRRRPDEGWKNQEKMDMRN